VQGYFRSTLVALLVFAPCWAAPVASGLPPGGKAAAKKKGHHVKIRPVCRRHERPSGKRHCVRAPHGAVRPRGVPQQGGHDDVLPEPKGTGLGAGGFDREEAAIAWAESKRHQRFEAWHCEQFVENAFNVEKKFKSAAVAEKTLPLQSGPPPRGAIVYFKAARDNRYLGHAGIALDKDTFISALDTVETSNLHQEYWANRYAGWTDAPEDWLGRFEFPDGTPSDIQQPPPNAAPTIDFTSPADGSKLSGTVTFTAHATNAVGVEFDAYYASDPTNVNTLDWHKLGAANSGANDNWALTYDTHSIPDQGDVSLNTVNIRAVVVDGAGNPTSVRQQHRVDVSNAAPTPPPVRKVITVDNRVTNGASMREDTSPALLTTQPWTFCGRRGCNIGGTERSSGQTFDAAVCQTTGERTTNGNDSSSADDANPERFESTRYYGVRLTNGTFGYVSEVWIRAADRGGLGLPGC
jgi:hypothetical protein